MGGVEGSCLYARAQCIMSGRLYRAVHLVSLDRGMRAVLDQVTFINALLSVIHVLLLSMKSLVGPPQYSVPKGFQIHVTALLVSHHLHNNGGPVGLGAEPDTMFASIRVDVLLVREHTTRDLANVDTDPASSDTVVDVSGSGCFCTNSTQKP